MSRRPFQPTGRMNLSWRAFDAAAAAAPCGATLGGWDVAAAVVDLSDPAQRSLGDYELIEELGRGGMGVVYRARQRSLDREVALKLLAGTLWTRPEAAARFAAEAASAARMRHPNIVAIHEFGSVGERCFYSMEFVEGSDLGARLRPGPLAEREALRLVRDLARAVHYAHALNVLHLDLKPQNVLLDADGRARIADFGLARPLDRALSEDTVDVVAGTPSYMAPEQALLHAAEISRSTDVYGLGAILYECLVGEPPFRGDSAETTLRQVVESPLAPPRARRSAISRDAEAIVLKCLQRDPLQRYASAEDLAEDLGRLLDGNAVQARRLRWSERAWRWLARDPVTPGGLATAAAIPLVAGIALGWQFDRHQRTDRVAGEAFAASAEALLATPAGKPQLEALQRVEKASFPWPDFRGVEARIDFHARLREAVATRAGAAHPLARELSLLLADDHRRRDAALWKAELARLDAPLADVLVALWYDEGDAGEHWAEFARRVIRLSQRPQLGDMELAIANNLCRWIDEMPEPEASRIGAACSTLQARARAAAPRNALFLLLAPQFDLRAHEAYLEALQAGVAFDDHGPRFYREALAMLEPVARKIAPQDLAHGLTPRDLAALALDQHVGTTFWEAQVRALEPCRALAHPAPAHAMERCRRTLALSGRGWTSWFWAAARARAERALAYAERGQPLPQPVPPLYDTAVHTALVECCTARGTHPEWVGRLESAGELDARRWLLESHGQRLFAAPP